MGRSLKEDLTGKRFGSLTAIKHIPKKGWECKCDCGNTKIVAGTYLMNGKVTSCGCRYNNHKEDLVGKRVGKLTVIKYIYMKGWECKCDCGNTAIYPRYDIVSERVNSCGCYKRKPKEDITGMKFGRLTPVEYIGNSKWKCKCDCGDTTIAISTDMKKGRRVSCGCAKKKKKRRI